MTDSFIQRLFLGRQPILGRNRQLVAYELLFRNGGRPADNLAEVLDPTQATSTVIANAFAEISISDALGPYRGFINVDRDFLFSEIIEVLPKELVALEILESVPPTPDVVTRCAALRAQGFMLAVCSDGAFDPASAPLFAQADVIKIDITRLSADALRTAVNSFKPLAANLLAEKVETVEQLEQCMALGFDLFQGYYFARPTIISGKKINPSQFVLIRIMELVMEDADTSRIENAFKQEPGLTVNLLHLTNSVSNGLATKITSLRHAITILGRRPLQRWLQLLIYTNPKDNSGSIDPLLQLAATRGRLMELLAERVQPRNREFAEHAFMVGIMSLMPALLGMPMKALLAELPVAPRVKLALSEYGGSHGALLKIVEATEQTDAEVIEEALKGTSGIHLDLLELYLSQALTWAHGIGQPVEAPAADED